MRQQVPGNGGWAATSTSSASTSSANGEETPHLSSSKVPEPVEGSGPDLKEQGYGG